MTVTTATAPRSRPEVLAARLRAALRAAGVAGHRRTATQAFLRRSRGRRSATAGRSYWAGRATLCADPDDLARYDQVFAAWFAGRRCRAGAPRRRLHAVPAGRRSATSDGGRRGRRATPSVLGRPRARPRCCGTATSPTLTAAERAELAPRSSARCVRAPARAGRSRRRRAARAASVDARRTLRDAAAPTAASRPRCDCRRRGDRPRRVVLLVDVSGSMSPYADSLLRLAHRWSRARDRAAYRGLHDRHPADPGDPGAAAARPRARPLAAAGDAVPDWSGGTRLGEVLEAFLDRWGQRGMARGAVVVIFSDGWERGDADLLGEQMRRLHRLAHRVVWVNPHRGKAGYQPVQPGIVAALPHVDDFVAGHSLAHFEELLEVVGRA